MVKKEEIDSLILSIPPKSDVLKQTFEAVTSGDLVKAAKIAETDEALANYLRNFVNKPIYFFKNEIKEVGQIFGILGTNGTKELLHHYMMSLFSPDDWKLFKLNEKRFSDLQAMLSTYWKKIMEHEKLKSDDISAVISLLPAAIIVTEMLFSKHMEEVQTLREVKKLDYNTILKRLVGMGLFDLAEKIGLKWEMNPKSINVLKASLGVKSCGDSNLCKLARYMHIMFFYVLSQPEMLKAGLNDFLDLQLEFVEPVYDSFQEIVGLS